MKQKIVFFTGAGISAESGLPTFRGANGIWKEIDAEKVASKRAWYCGRFHNANKRRQAVLDFVNPIRREILAHKPNEAHRIMADFERDFDVTVITQNGDDYHERAGSSRVIHLHGEALKNSSTLHPYEAVDIDREHPDIHIGDKAADGSQVRPYVTLFGEELEMPLWKQAVQASREADFFVVVGSSLSVHPAADLLGEINGLCRLFVIDPDQVDLPEGISRRPMTYIQKKASAGMRRLKRMLVPIKIYASEYDSTGYFDLIDLTEHYPAEHDGKEVTPEAYWQEERHLEDLVEMLSHSVFYRKQMQEMSKERIAESFAEEAPLLCKVRESGLLQKCLEKCKARMSDYMLVRVPKETALTFHGETYQGIEAIKKADGKGTVFSICKLFPCFDSSDFAYENRYYRNYWFCGNDLSAQRVINSLEADMNSCRICEHLPKEAIPMVYYVDERKTMLVAYEEGLKCLD